MSDEITFPVEWVTGCGDEPMEESSATDEVTMLHAAFDEYAIEWKLVPDPRTTSYWDRGKKAYKIKGVKKPLSHDEAFAYLSTKYGYKARIF